MDKDLDCQQNQEQTNISLGEIFKKQRISKKIDLAKASEFLKVRVRDLQAIENNEIEKISKNIYTPGLIKSYGKFLKINNKLIQAKLDQINFKSNTENKKHLLINIGEHLELTPKKELLINISIIFFITFFIMIFALNLYKKNLLNFPTNLIIEDIKKIENDNHR